MLKLIYDNTRLGFLCVPDILTELRALEPGQELLQETIERYGVAAYAGAVRYACDASAEAMAEGLRSLPDCAYEGEDSIDGDGSIRRRRSRRARCGTSTWWCHRRRCATPRRRRRASSPSSSCTR